MPLYRRFARCPTVFLLLVLAAGSSLRAQSGPLGELIPNLFDRTIVLAATAHEAHFVDSSRGLVEAGNLINDSIVSQLGTLPITSSAGGFTYTFDPALGVMTRTSESFGPIFTERAATIGKGKWNVGVNTSRYQYDSLDGLDLDEDEITQSFTHLDTNHDGTTVATVYEGDLILADANLDLSQDVTVFSATWGAGERFDLAFAIPLVRVQLDAALDTHIRRLATEGLENPPQHRFADGGDQAVYRASGSSSGVGDIQLRGKFAMIRKEGRGLALGVDVRLPTGDEDELLGTGATAVRVQLLGSANFGRLATHVNFGYTGADVTDSSKADLSDEFNFSLAADLAVHERVTLVGEILWRTLIDAPTLEVGDTTHLYQRFDSDQITSTTRPVLDSRRDDLNIATAVVGAKWNLWGQVLVSTHLMIALNDDGLRDTALVPTIGIDYSF
ncbi:MAG: transporter [Thermoanaerobaculia bacterium]